MVLAGSVDGARAFEGLTVRRNRLLCYRTVDLAPLVECPAQEVVGISTDQALWKIERLDQEEPMVVGLGEGPVRARVHGRSRRNIEYRQPFHRFRMIYGKTVSDPSAAIMTGDTEPRNPSCCITWADHRHRTLRIVEMVLATFGLARCAVTPQMGSATTVKREASSSATLSTHMRLWKAVQEEQRWTRTRRSHRWIWMPFAS